MPKQAVPLALLLLSLPPSDAHIRLLFDMQDAIDGLVADPSDSSAADAAGGSSGSMRSSSRARMNDGGGGGGGGSWNVTLADVCLKPLGSECATQSVLQYWGMSRDAFEHGGRGAAAWALLAVQPAADVLLRAQHAAYLAGCLPEQPQAAAS